MDRVCGRRLRRCIDPEDFIIFEKDQITKEMRKFDQHRA